MEDYNEKIAQAKEILKGNVRKTSATLYEKMMQLAQEMRFEEAQELKKQYELNCLVRGQKARWLVTPYAM